MNLKDFFCGLDSLFSQKNLPAVENYLHQHLEIAKKAGDTCYQLAVLNEQVGYYRSLSLISQALTAGEQAMAIISAPDFTENIATATTMLNVATALRAGGHNIKALELYGKVNIIYSAALASDDTRRAALYNNMAQALMATGDIKAALASLHKALTILELSQEACAETATTHSNIALLYMSLGNNETAAAHLQAALSGFETLGYDDAHYPAALAAMAQLMYIEKKYPDAIKYYHLALNKNASVFGENADYARICRNCARVYSMSKLPKQAEAMLKKAQAVEISLKAANRTSERSDQ